MLTSRPLLAAIMTFDIDGGPAAEPFAARLAREQGWTREFADRVIVEYRRFLFLAVTTGQAATPSKAVDEAWHLHLTYTRSYWDRLCGTVLGRALHHDPSTGGPIEAATFKGLHDRTLERYREAFGVVPPPDIWPSANPIRRADSETPASRIVSLEQPGEQRLPHAGRSRRLRCIALTIALTVMPLMLLGVAGQDASLGACIGPLIVAVLLVAAIVAYARRSSARRGRSVGATESAANAAGRAACESMVDDDVYYGLPERPVKGAPIHGDRVVPNDRPGDAQRVSEDGGGAEPSGEGDGSNDAGGGDSGGGTCGSSCSGGD